MKRFRKALLAAVVAALLLVPMAQVASADQRDRPAKQASPTATWTTRGADDGGFSSRTSFGADDGGYGR